MAKFMRHLRFHGENVVTKCMKCTQRVHKQDFFKHLTKCHGFGLYQCCFCKYGTNDVELMRSHLSDLHYDNLPFVCHRIASHNTVSEFV